MATAFPKSSLSTRHPDGSPPPHRPDAACCDDGDPTGGGPHARTARSGQPVLGRLPRRDRVSALGPVGTPAAAPETFFGEAVRGADRRAGCLVAGTAATATAGGQAHPRVGSMTLCRCRGSVNPGIHTCDDPDDPCYTAPQMHSYLGQEIHKFYRLRSSFRFSAAFIHLAQAAHDTWCSHHPSECKAQKAQWRADARANPNDSCGHNWWCHERGLISCAGGALEPYWSCDGAYHQDTTEATRPQAVHHRQDAHRRRRHDGVFPVPARGTARDRVGSRADVQRLDRVELRRGEPMKPTNGQPGPWRRLVATYRRVDACLKTRNRMLIVGAVVVAVWGVFLAVKILP